MDPGVIFQWPKKRRPNLLKKVEKGVQARACKIGKASFELPKKLNESPPECKGKAASFETFLLKRSMSLSPDMFSQKNVNERSAGRTERDKKDLDEGNNILM